MAEVVRASGVYPEHDVLDVLMVHPPLILDVMKARRVCMIYDRKCSVRFIVITQTLFHTVTANEIHGTINLVLVN